MKITNTKPIIAIIKGISKVIDNNTMPRGRSNFHNSNGVKLDRNKIVGRLLMELRNTRYEIVVSGGTFASSNNFNSLQVVKLRENSVRKAVICRIDKRRVASWRGRGMESRRTALIY